MASAKTVIQLGTRLIKPSCGLGKTALVTGSATGLGKSSAVLMARQGARVVISDLAKREAECQGVVEEIKAFGGSAMFVPLNVTKEADWATAVKSVEKEFGELDVVVNNAGVGTMFNDDGTPVDIYNGFAVENITLNQWRSLLSVNLDGVFLGNKYALQSMKKNKSPETKSIINMSSILGFVGFPGAYAYCASKGAVRNMTKAIALYCQQVPELKTVRVNSVHPGFIDTEMTAGTKDQHDAIASMAAMNRYGKPDEIGHAVVYLASDESSYVTGTEIVVDGGFLAH